MIGFARPWLFGLLLLLPWWWWRRRRQQAVAAVVSDTSAFSAATRGRWKLLVPPGLRALSLVALLTAAAGPYRPGDRVVVSANGIAIVIAIDVSTSMMAEDLGLSNRIDIAKKRRDRLCARPERRPHRAGDLRRRSADAGAGDAGLSGAHRRAFAMSSRIARGWHRHRFGAGDRGGAASQGAGGEQGDHPAYRRRQ